MSAHTVSTQYVSIKGTKIAYRRLEKPSAIPLLYLTHFHGTVDLIDALLLNSITTSRSLIIMDNAGVGHSSGNIQPTIQEAGSTVMDFLNAIDVPKVDIIWFSMGGFIAQSIAVNSSHVVNKLVLAGTQSSYTEGFVAPDPAITAEAGQDNITEEAMMKLFFYPSDTSRALGHAFWQRITERNVDGEERTTFVDVSGGQTQNGAIGAFVSDPGFFLES